MKKFYAILCLAIASLTQLQAQAPQGFNYQATVRNSSGDLVVNTNVYFKFNVIQGSQTAVPIFTETHYVPTDDLGQVILVIGQGTATTGTFSALDWSLGSYYLGIELSINGANNYVAMGTTQLLSVPYALYAENSGNSTPTTPNLETVLAENNSANNQQIKDLQDPTEAQDAVTMIFLMEKISELQDQIDALQAATGSGSITDQDGNTYDYLTYGDQVWTVENAEMATYRDGTPIPQVTDNTDWESLTTGAWSYYDNDPTKPRLYNWYAVMGIHDNDPNTPNKEFSPQGWHVPTGTEWTTLEEHLIANGYNYDGTTTENKIAKAMASTTGWNSSTNAGGSGNDQSTNNSSGFNAFPEGGRINDGSFSNEGISAVFWSSTENNTNNAWNRTLYYYYSYLTRNSFISKQFGHSVRFVKGASLNDVNDTDISGTWRLAPEAGALGLGPELNNISWWSNTSDDVTTRACQFDDEYVFNADGSFQNVVGAETWVIWQGAAAQGCDVPVAPHDGTATATYTYDEAAGTITLNGAGAYLGLAKVINGDELTSPTDAPDSITYIAALSEDGNTLELDIEVANGGHWSFKLVKY